MPDQNYKLSPEALFILRARSGTALTITNRTKIGKLQFMGACCSETAHEVFNLLLMDRYDKVELIGRYAYFGLIGWKNDVPYAVSRLGGEPTEKGFRLSPDMLHGARFEKGDGYEDLDINMDLWASGSAMAGILLLIAAGAANKYLPGMPVITWGFGALCTLAFVVAAVQGWRKQQVLWQHRMQVRDATIKHEQMFDNAATA